MIIPSGASIYIKIYCTRFEKKLANLKAAYHRDKHKAEANVHIVADNWSKKMEKLQHASVQKKSEGFQDSLKTVSGCKISGVIPFCSEDGQMLSN